MQRWKWDRWIMKLPALWSGTFSAAKVNKATRDAFSHGDGARKHIHTHVAGRFAAVGILLTGLTVSQPVLSSADTTDRHLTLDEIVVTGDAVTGPMRTEVGVKKEERRTIYAYSSGWPAQQHFKLVELNPYITADINLKIPVTGHAEASCYVENLFDEEYEEQFGYPMPGIIIGAALKMSF